MPQTPKKLSRRDALKVLGAAAGATALANLPSRWTTPELRAGVLPAHAQSSGHTLDCDISDQGTFPDFTVVASVHITPADQNILMHYEIVLNSVTTAHPLSGNVATNGFGDADVTFDIQIQNGFGFVDVTWSFASAADGAGDCTKTVTES